MNSSVKIWQDEAAPDRWIVTVNGRLDHSLNPTLEQQLLDLLEDGNEKLIVDLTGTDYINSGGLRTLVAAWRKARQQSGDLVLCGLDGRLQEIFAMVGFDQLFQIFPNLPEALDSLKSA